MSTSTTCINITYETFLASNADIIKVWEMENPHPNTDTLANYRLPKEKREKKEKYIALSAKSHMIQIELYFLAKMIEEIKDIEIDGAITDPKKITTANMVTILQNLNASSVSAFMDRFINIDIIKTKDTVNTVVDLPQWFYGTILNNIKDNVSFPDLIARTFSDLYIQFVKSLASIIARFIYVNPHKVKVDKYMIMGFFNQAGIDQYLLTEINDCVVDPIPRKKPVVTVTDETAVTNDAVTTATSTTVPTAVTVTTTAATIPVHTATASTLTTPIATTISANLEDNIADLDYINDNDANVDYVDDITADNVDDDDIADNTGDIEADEADDTEDVDE